MPFEIRFPCEICDKSFSLESYVNIHKKQVHSGGEPSNECATCGIKFHRKNNLKKHVKAVHVEDIALRKCDKCEERAL